MAMEGPTFRSARRAAGLTASATGYGESAETS
jgi:hypothetical protein